MRRIRDLIPHQGAMCLLDAVVSWSESEVACRAVSHLDPANPLRRDGRLPVVAGIEYGLQAAALHGALTQDQAQRAGFLAALRSVSFHADRLDRSDDGPLEVRAILVASDASGSIYRIEVRAADRSCLLEARATIALPPR